ncbi:MAG: oxidoreductase [Marinomonas sp.]|nr:oxidoreductase [Marinomonas sp.]
MKNVIVISDGEARVDLNDPWQFGQEGEQVECSARVDEVATWLKHSASSRSHGVLIQKEEELELIAPYLANIVMIALTFKDFKDGRAYSLAYLLRTRFHFKGDLRAVGDVMRDQLSLMRQCGFTSFVIKEGKDPFDALKGIKGLSVTYSGSVSNPAPLFKRVRRY